MSNYVAQGYPLWLVEIERNPWGDAHERDEYLPGYASGEDAEYTIQPVIAWLMGDRGPIPATPSGLHQSRDYNRWICTSREEAEERAQRAVNYRAQRARDILALPAA